MNFNYTILFICKLFCQGFVSFKFSLTDKNEFKKIIKTEYNQWKALSDILHVENRSFFNGVLGDRRCRTPFNVPIAFDA